MSWAINGWLWLRLRLLQLPLLLLNHQMLRDVGFGATAPHMVMVWKPMISCGKNM